MRNRPTKYVISKGDHSSGFRIRPHFTNSIRAEVTFDRSCAYQSEPNTQLREQINKLFGLSFGFGHHHKNSFRFGWNFDPDHNKVKIYSYFYRNGIREHKYLTSLDLNEKYLLEIIRYKDQVHFDIQTVNHHIVEVFDEPGNFGYFLYPYFGGKLPAPHSMNIILKRIKI